MSELHFYEAGADSYNSDMRISLFSFAALGLVLFGLTACSTALRQKAPHTDTGAVRQTHGMQAKRQPDGARSDPDVGAGAARHALGMRGRPYQYGGNTPQGFDCSGLIQYSYARAGMKVPRSTEGLWAGSRSVSSSQIRPGDLLFFHQEGKRNSHVALYIGDDRFVHSPSSGKQVSTASLSDPYWRRHFSAARRPSGA